MRVVLAPDSFGGSMSADAVAEVFGWGWHEVAPDDELLYAPLSDGGPGLVPVLAFCHPDTDDFWVDATGPTGAVVRTLLIQIGSTVYVESAAVCGLDALRAAGGDVRTATTYGVGQLLAAAAARAGVETVVVGLGGSGTNDGGAGMWAALGAEPAEILHGGGVALKALESVTAPEPVGVRLIAATDVDNPLLGMHGASNVYGPQKGADQATIMALDVGLERWADAVEAAVGLPGVRNQPGAGAAGKALSSPADEDLLVFEIKVEGADLVVTGEGRFDSTSLRGKVVSGVARVAQEAGVPCVVAAGQASVGARDAAAAGIDEVFSVTDLLGSAEAALAADQDGVRQLGRAVARSWSR